MKFSSVKELIEWAMRTSTQVLVPQCRYEVERGVMKQGGATGWDADTRFKQSVAVLTVLDSSTLKQHERALLQAPHLPAAIMDDRIDAITDWYVSQHLGEDRAFVRECVRYYVRPARSTGLRGMAKRFEVSGWKARQRRLAVCAALDVVRNRAEMVLAAAFPALLREEVGAALKDENKKMTETKIKTADKLDFVNNSAIKLHDGVAMPQPNT